MTLRQAPWLNVHMTDVTNESLGGLIGLTHSAVSRLLAGERTPSVMTMRRIADVFNVSVDEILRAATQDSKDADRRGHLWGAYFTGLVERADLDQVRERAEVLDHGVVLATAAG